MKETHLAVLGAISGIATNVFFTNCSNGLFTDTTWQNLNFNTTFAASNYNIDYSGTGCTTAITINGDSSKTGYGSATAKDPQWRFDLDALIFSSP